LHDVFGVREKHVWMRREPRLVISDSDSVGAQHAAPLQQLTAGLHSLRGALYASTVDVLSKDARVLATIDGEPAVVASRYGKGETLFIGSYIGWGNQPEQQRDNTEFIRRLADWAGVTKPVGTTHDGTNGTFHDGTSHVGTTLPLIARLHEGVQGGGYLLFLINHDSAGRDAAVTVRLPAGSYALTELIGGTTRSATAEGGILRLETHLAGQDAQVWALRAP
jgi:beta-galactosidase